MSKFTGVVAGVTYTDRAAFEKAARDAGHRLGHNRTGDWRVGVAVSVRFVDEPAATQGQVWCKGPAPRCGYVIAALDDGRWTRVYTNTGRVEEINALGHTLEAVGKVAA